MDFNKINLGHILTIVALIGTLFAFWSRFEARLAVVETNVEWLVKTTSSVSHIAPPPSSK